jgi:hypothetical protein
MTKQEVARPWLVLAAGAAVAVAGTALFFASSESVLRSSFETALDNRANVPPKELASSSTPPISGSEDFWLSAMRDGTAPLNKTVSVGDQISLNLGGVHRTLEVATVSDFSPQFTQIDTSAAPTHLVLVTAHDLNDSTARPVRFVMEIQQGGLPVVAGRSGRTL